MLASNTQAQEPIVGTLRTIIPIKHTARDRWLVKVRVRQVSSKIPLKVLVLFILGS